MTQPADFSETPSAENRLDFTFILMGQLATILSSPRAAAERYNACMEMSVLLHPFHDDIYKSFAQTFFKRPEGERVKATGAWLQALMDLLYRTGFLGTGGGGD